MATKVKKEPTYEDRFERLSWFKKLGVLIKSKPPKFNMPKRQSCPICSAQSKRIRYTSSGAEYGCRNHDKFIVIRPNLMKDGVNLKWQVSPLAT